MRTRINNKYLYPRTTGYEFTGSNHVHESETFANMVERRLVNHDKYPTIRLRHSGETSILLVSTKHEAIM